MSATARALRSDSARMESIRARGAAPPGPTGPTTELGAPAQLGVIPWAQFFRGDDSETTPDVMWPNSVQTYAAMMNDAQIEGLLYGATLPIRRYLWYLTPNGARPEVVEGIAKDLNLPIGIPLPGEQDRFIGRSKDRFNFDRHMFHALRALAYGHYYFEQVGVIGDDGLWHLRKLAPRPPRTIMEIDVSPVGGLVQIKQNISRPGLVVQPIPVERLVAYVWDQEGSNWVGRSMLRSIYRNWLIKDRLLRVDAVKHERNGMGVPIIEGFQGAEAGDLQELNRLAQKFKAGETSGGAIPYGAKFTLQGTMGTIPDTISSIRFHNEEMARRFLMMFIQLGESLHGNRSLGSDFIDYFQLAQEAIANWFRDVTNEHVIEDWVDFNFGPDEQQVPILQYLKRETELGSDATAPLADLVASGVIQVDPGLAAALTGTSPPATPPPGTQAKRRMGVHPVRAEAPSSPATAGVLPDRPLRRNLNDNEIQAQVNFAHIDYAWQSGLTTLFASWQAAVTANQIQELKEKVGASKKIEDLSSLSATPMGADLLEAHMGMVYDQGVASAQSEAVAQGVTISTPTDKPSYSDRAAATASIAASFIAGQAATKAMRLSGALAASEMGTQVQGYLDSLKFTELNDRLGGALSAALNDGRRAVMAAGPAAKYYSSEILDVNTCGPCTDIDGTEYATLQDSERDYVGGYINCSGGDRCRGTVYAVYEGVAQ